MNNLLYIAPQDSYPYTDGGKISIFFPMKEFAKEYNVFYAFIVRENDDNNVLKYKEFNIKAFPYKMDLNDHYENYLKTLFSDLSFKFYKFFNKDFLNILSKIVEEHHIDTIWICHAQMAKYGIELKKKFPKLKIFLREHNIEYVLVKQFLDSQTNIFMKIISYLEYLKTKKYEIGLWKNFDKVFFISDTDLKTAKKHYNKLDNSNLLYDGMELPNITENIPLEENSFIFTGSFSSFQNENNLRYFIKNIWFSFIKKVPDAKLYLTGNQDDTLVQKLKISKQELENNNIINLGFVDDIKKTILSKQFVVSPTLYGSGIRLKVLEALSLKKVVFVSDIDYEMASCFKDMENIVHYSLVDDFYQKFTEIKDKNLYDTISINGYRLIKNYFNWEKYFIKVEKNVLQGKNATDI